MRKYKVDVLDLNGYVAKMIVWESQLHMLYEMVNLNIIRDVKLLEDNEFIDMTEGE